MTKITKSHYDRLDQRRLWLTNRIEAKEKTGWETQYDESERDALTAALAVLEVDTTPDPGEGYRRAKGEDWKDGRCEYYHNGKWLARDANEDGRPFDEYRAYRIPIDPAPKHPPVPEGWRWLGKDEVVEKGDQYLSSASGEWTEVEGDIGKIERDFWYPHIRRIEPTYRPFASAEEFRPHRDRWWRHALDHGAVAMPPASYGDKDHGGISWQRSFERKVFDDGSPFGVEVK